MEIESRKLRIMFSKSGGTASKNAQVTRIALPVKWIKDLGLTMENREVKTTYDGKRIIIEPFPCQEDK